MHIVIKGTKTVQEFMEAHKSMEELAQKAFEAHKDAVEEWKYGKPIKVWLDKDMSLCVEYENGNWWHYKGLDSKCPSWW